MKSKIVFEERLREDQDIMCVKIKSSKQYFEGFNFVSYYEEDWDEE